MQPNTYLKEPIERNFTNEFTNSKKDFKSEKVEEFKNMYRKECGNQKIDYVPIFTDQKFDLALSEYTRKRSKSR